jgi:acetoacetyl-CoA synthetase
MKRNILWTPTESQVRSSHLAAFMKEAETAAGNTFENYAQLWEWSIQHRDAFWSLLWDSCGVIGHKGETVLENGDDMEKAVWFPEARLNYAQNLLQVRNDETAIVFRAEDQCEYSLTWNELYEQVASVAAWLRAQGVTSGMRVAAYLPNMPETIVAMLATTSLGAVWTSTSPDFGEDSVIDRFGQTRPDILFCADGYFYNGKRHESRSRVRNILQALPSVREVVEIPLLNLEGQKTGVVWSDVLNTGHNGIDFVQTDFDHPLYILYSSGTTGKPKCIVHRSGGVLLQHLKEHQLHSNIRPGDRVFYFTTCGWMMWNWLASALASSATVMLYDGSPFAPDGSVLWDFADDHDFTLFGTSAKYLEALNKAKKEPKTTHQLKSLRTLCSTGSPLAPELFEYVYESIKSDVNLASICGGTDIVSCFVLGNPMLPVYRGEVQCRGLGMAVDVFDDDGKAVRNQKGELVCTKPFPCQPRGFWEDDTGQEYHDAYFGRFENTWHHGDYVLLNDHGGMVIYGRSDATLNPGGVRIGTAEIYRHVEQLEEIIESIVIGQDWENDVRIVLFVVLTEGFELTDELVSKIKSTVRQKCSPRHMPAKVIAVPEIPRTKSGKIVELAVRDVVHNRPIKNLGALANPHTLENFKGLEDLET